jgi:ubiquitin
MESSNKRTDSYAAALLCPLLRVVVFVRTVTNSEISAEYRPLPTVAMRLFVKKLTEEIIELQVDQADTIEAVKDAIARRDGTPQDQQRLIFQGKQLEDGRRLTDYGIAEDAEILIVLRLRGD